MTITKPLWEQIKQKNNPTFADYGLSDDAQELISSNTGRISSLEADVADLESVVAVFAQDVTELESAVTTAVEKSNQASSEVYDITGRVDTAEENITALTDTADSHQDRISALETSSENFESDISELKKNTEDDHNQIQQNVADIEEALERGVYNHNLILGIQDVLSDKSEIINANADNIAALKAGVGDPQTPAQGSILRRLSDTETLVEQLTGTTIDTITDSALYALLDLVFTGTATLPAGDNTLLRLKHLQVFAKAILKLTELLEATCKADSTQKDTALSVLINANAENIAALESRITELESSISSAAVEIQNLGEAIDIINATALEVEHE